MFSALRHCAPLARNLAADSSSCLARGAPGGHLGFRVVTAGPLTRAHPFGPSFFSGLRGKPDPGSSGITKEPVSAQVKLSDGKTATVRRLEPTDAAAFSDYLRASHLSVESFRDEYDFKRSHPRSDALVAVIEGRVVGMATIDAEPGFFCGPIGPDFSGTHGVDPDNVCFGESRLDPAYSKSGAVWAMIKTQVEAAHQAGFKAVAFETGCKTTKEVAQAMGGTVQEGEGTTWVVVPMRPEFSGPR